MILGIGIDMVRIARIHRLVTRWGEHFVDRIFTALEKETCFKRASPASALALRFAAKEAFSKAIGLGMRRGIRWRDIEVFHHPTGRPGLKLSGAARDESDRMGVARIHVTLSDEGEYGIAMVLLEGNGLEEDIC
jgi:holo-[acyl-carrier protein] synthase